MSETKLAVGDRVTEAVPSQLGWRRVGEVQAVYPSGLLWVVWADARREVLLPEAVRPVSRYTQAGPVRALPAPKVVWAYVVVDENGDLTVITNPAASPAGAWESAPIPSVQRTAHSTSTDLGLAFKALMSAEAGE